MYRFNQAQAAQQHVTGNMRLCVARKFEKAQLRFALKSGLCLLSVCGSNGLERSSVVIVSDCVVRAFGRATRHACSVNVLDVLITPSLLRQQTSTLISKA